MTRADARRRASECVEALDRRFAAHEAWLLPGVTPARALHGHLVGIAADFEDRGGPTPRVQLWRRSATVARDRVLAALRTAPLLAADGPTALFIARRPGHLAALTPLADRLRSTSPLRPRWLVSRPDMARDLRHRGHDTMDLHSVGARTVRPELDAWRTWLATRAGARSPLESALLDELASQLPLLVITAVAIERAVHVLAPAVVIVGNPYSAEGALAAAAARARGVPVVTVQHGDIAPGQPEWTRADFDVVCVWGETARDTLVAAGVASSRIAVTGAPWAVTHARRPVGGRHVLVALSGSGHLVGPREHEAHVRAVDAAARALVETDWRVRLHPKDSAATWRNVSGSPRYELIEAPSWPIERDIAWADVLVTATSTAGLDALRLGRDVVNIERGPGEVVPEYVRAGATVGAAPEALGRVVRAVLRDGAPAETRERGRAFLARTLGTDEADVAARMRDVVVSIANIQSP